MPYSRQQQRQAAVIKTRLKKELEKKIKEGDLEAKELLNSLNNTVDEYGILAIKELVNLNKNRVKELKKDGTMDKNGLRWIRTDKNG